MGEVIWIETLSGHRDVLSRQRCELAAGGQVVVGRAYDCDVILEDPFVAPRHVRIFRDEAGRLQAEDLGSVNGLFLDHETARHPCLPLDGDAPVRIGRTFLRVRDTAAAVAPEREEPRAARTWQAVVVSTAVLVALTLVETWIEDTGESKLSTYVFAMFALGALVLSWTAIWTVLARIFGGIAHFERHLFFATTGFLTLIVIEAVIEQLAYSLSLTSLSAVESFGTWIWLGVLSFFHLREIAPRHLALNGAVLATFAILGIGGQALTQAETGGLFDSHVAITALKPPESRIAAPESERQFFEQARALAPKLQRARTEDAPSGSLLGDLDLDD